MQKAERAACDEEQGKRKTHRTKCTKVRQNLCIISGMGLMMCDSIERTPWNKVGRNLCVTRVTDAATPQSLRGVILQEQERRWVTQTWVRGGTKSEALDSYISTARQWPSQALHKSSDVTHTSEITDDETRQTFHLSDIYHLQIILKQVCSSHSQAKTNTFTKCIWKPHICAYRLVSLLTFSPAFNYTSKPISFVKYLIQDLILI